jgi:hypothetical protein
MASNRELPMRTVRNSVLTLVVAALSLPLLFCIHTYSTVTATDLKTDTLSAPTQVSAPLRIHLINGGIVQFRYGAAVSRTEVSGRGIRYDMSLRDTTAVAVVPLDSVLGIEVFQAARDRGKGASVSVAATIGMTVLTIGGLVAIACTADPKCFGSCPTVYTKSTDGTHVLEAELFSFSIAPLLEGRDVDRLGIRPDARGRVAFDVRNEAMETHYINHLELLHAAVETGEEVYPDERGIPVAVAQSRQIARAVDIEGRNVLASVMAPDSAFFSSSPERLRRVSLERLNDFIEFTAPADPQNDSVAIVFRVRNSLLSSTLFYDVMLGRAGASALNWLGGDLQAIGSVAQLGRWYAQRMGLRVSVWDGARFLPVTRVPNTGPIAWKELAVVVPSGNRDAVRIRLDFTTDEWRIDAITVATQVRRPTVTRFPITEVVDPDDIVRADLRDQMLKPDDNYAVTTAGDRMTIVFQLPQPLPSGTLLLSSQGYYTEWIRPDWIRGGDGIAFEPSDHMLLEALQRWRAVRPEFERRFFVTRIPTR